MKGGARKFGAADRRLLPEGRLAGPMPWVIAIMMFLTVLAAAAGLGLGGAAANLNAAVGDRVTVQVMEPNPDAREADASRVVELLRHLPGVRNVHRLTQAEINRLLEPWLGAGAGGTGSDLPIPAMIDADLGPGGGAHVDEVREALARVVPSARLDRNGEWLGPLGRLIS
ncbi:MAG: cell division protein, partial [Candidatus Eremiobacteraeota bacterium]|nr:cell division protein [Candidatus Eremiobacteraeota bacterium]